MILSYIKLIGLPRQTLVFVRSKACVCSGKHTCSGYACRWLPAGDTYCKITVFSHPCFQHYFGITKEYHFSIPYDLFYHFPFRTNLSRRIHFSPFSLILTRKSRQMLPLATFVHQKDGNLPPPSYLLTYICIQRAF